jgi:hypothetical protein
VRIAEYGVQSAECGVRSAESGIRSAESGIWSAECGVRSAECGVRSAKYSKNYLFFLNIRSILSRLRVFHFMGHKVENAESIK